MGWFGAVGGGLGAVGESINQSINQSINPVRVKFENASGALGCGPWGKMPKPLSL